MKNFVWVIGVVLIGFLIRSIYKGNSKLTLAIFLGLLLAAAVWVILYLLKRREKNAELEFLRQYQDAIDESIMDRMGKEIEDKDIEIAGLKVQLEVSQDNYDELETKFNNLQEHAHKMEKEICELDEKCREYEKREEVLDRTVPGIQAMIYRKVIERLKGTDRWEGVRTDLFDDGSEKCKNAYEHLLLLYRYHADECGEDGCVTRQLKDWLMAEYWDLDQRDQNDLEKIVKDLNLMEMLVLYPDATWLERNKWLRGDEVDNFLWLGFEDFVKKQEGTEWPEIKIDFFDH